MAGMVGGAPPWPELREELRLHPGPVGRGGEPSWTLHDPAAQRFFRMGWLEVEILNRWSLGSPEAIAAAVSRETTLAARPAAVEAMRNFLLANSLAAASSPADVKRLVKQRYGKKTSLLMLTLKNYLFIRVPLLRPDAFLARTAWVGAWLFSRRTAAAAALLALAGFYLIGRQWSGFQDSFASLLTFNGGLTAMAAVAAMKALHEIGHAYAAKALGLRVPTMGISLMCFAPVLWTDTTEAWKLARRRDRLFIDAAGVYTEWIPAAAAAVLWSILPPGGLKTAAFMAASSSWILTLTVNINPCMRYDGYYLLSDYWNMPGLQTRSFALAKWWLRERLFGFGLSPPETFSRWDACKLIVYAFVTWVYRLFLFLGIAFLVYHLFFKALGALLMLVELVFFIAMPIGAEIIRWIGLRKHFRPTFRLARTALLLAAALAFLVHPWHSRVGGAAFLFAERQELFFAPRGAMVEEGAADGTRARAGDALFRLRSPDLDSRIDQAGHKVTTQREKLSLASLDAALRAEMTPEWEELERLAEDLAGMLAERENLTLRASFAGVLRDVPPGLEPGSWVAAKEGLGILASGGGMVAAYVAETDWNRLETGAAGRFYGSGKGWEPIALRIVRIDSQATEEILHPELASTLGGPLAVRKDPEGRLKPEQAVYRVLCHVETPVSGTFDIGYVSLEAQPRSLVSLLWNNLIGVLIRESGW